MKQVPWGRSEVENKVSKENEIRALITRMSALANRRDVDGLMALYDVEATAFHFGERVTLEGNRQNCAKGYLGLRGEFTYEFLPIRVEGGSRIAYVFGEERVKGATESGPFASTINATYCLKKIGESWLITHQHLSMQNQR